MTMKYNDGFDQARIARAAAKRERKAQQLLSGGQCPPKQYPEIGEEMGEEMGIEEMFTRYGSVQFDDDPHIYTSYEEYCRRNNLT